LGIDLVSQLSNSDLENIDAHILAHKGVPGGLMPLLHAIQDDIGYVPEEVYPKISQALALSVAEVHGFVTFYHYFRTHPVGKHYHETTADGEITLLPVYCLGNCACSPAVMMDEEVVGRVDAKTVAALVSEVTNG